MFMRANIIEACLMKFLEMVHSHLQKLEPSEDKLEATIDFLDLNSAAIDRHDCNACLTGPEGKHRS